MCILLLHVLSDNPGDGVIHDVSVCSVCTSMNHECDCIGRVCCLVVGVARYFCTSELLALIMNDSAVEQTLRDDIDWCFDVVEEVSRTFALTISELEPPFSEWICAGYLLCRVADTIEDASHIPPVDQVELLQTYRGVIDPDGHVTVDTFLNAVSEWVPDVASGDWQVVAETDRVVRVFESFDERVQEAMRPVVVEMVDGMAMFIQRYADSGGLRIQSIDELEEYCWYVAGTVGEMITNLLQLECNVDESQLKEHEQSFALLLQLVNVAKDVPDDYATENNVYLPAEWLAEEGVQPDGVTVDENVSAVAAVVGRVTDRACQYTSGAYNYLLSIPETDTNMLEAFSIPYLLALGTIRELEEDTETAVRAPDEVKVSREEVFAVLTSIQQGFSKDDLRELRGVIRSQPLPETVSQ